MPFDINNEISQANKNMGYIAQAINKGIITGELSLLDHDNIKIFRSFTNNLCALNEKLLQITTVIQEPSYGILQDLPIQCLEFDSDKSSLTNSVHNSDVTGEPGNTQEQLSCHRVSEFAGSSEEHVMSSDSYDKYHDKMNKPKKRYSTSTEGDIVAKKKGKRTQKNTTAIHGLGFEKKNITKTQKIIRSCRSNDKEVFEIVLEDSMQSENERIGHKELCFIDWIEEYIHHSTTKDDNLPRRMIDESGESLFCHTFSFLNASLDPNEYKIICNQPSSTDLSAVVERGIDLCSDEDLCSYHAQCLVILVTDMPMVTSNNSISSMSSLNHSDRSKLTVPKYLEDRIVKQMIVIQRPLEHCQIYVARDLGSNYHFSFPTSEIVHLYNVMKEQNNAELQILFIPRICKQYEGTNLIVFNNLSRNHLSWKDSDFVSMSQTISSMSTSGNKRSSDSISIGLQTIYSHQQHVFRYCMLPHSKPHVPTVKQYPVIVRDAILDGYMFACKVMEKINKDENKNPFALYEDSCHAFSKEIQKTRFSLRLDLFEHLISNDLEPKEKQIIMNNMFESCSVQTMGKLPFHCDTMNCPLIDKTVALHVPYESTEANKKNCMSFLYYSRKCVGDFASRCDVIHKFLNNQKNCLLTTLCLSAILHTEGIFDYQGTLFENSDSLDKLARTFESDQHYSCPDITRFTGLSCFKQGAAFDKMGYYSILLNVFFSLHYMDILTSVDDSISLCIYFGLICNGTSNLAATWKYLLQNISFCKEWCSRKESNSTKLFNLLVFLEKQKRKSNKGDKDLLGSCKLPRYQYSNYAAFIEAEADVIHCLIKDFLLHRIEKQTREGDVYSLHSELKENLSRLKGVGPLSFNQLWHSLCLCGVLPLTYINTTPIALESGPAKLIQTFYPTCKTVDSLRRKAQDVKANISKMGISSITSFFIENEMCELWRFGNKSKLASKNMSVSQRKAGFISQQFITALVQSKPTKNADIYFRNPLTGHYQHLFRVMDKKILSMRLSFLDNEISSSVIVRCSINNDKVTGKVSVTWEGDYVRRSGDKPSSWFIV
jgi:hypothetical protein